MILSTLIFLTGDFSYFHLPLQPQRWMLLLLLIAATLLFWTTKNRIIFLLFGFCYAALTMDSITQHKLPLEKEDIPQQVSGIIDSLPIVDKFGSHFTMANMKLSWPNKTNLRVGDEYQLTVKLKRIHGVHNPGSFDYETWALQHHLYAQGTVVKNQPPVFIKHHFFKAPVEQIRQHYYNLLTPLLPQSDTSPWLLALMLGEKHSVKPEQWQILRATGTNHLMAIAGLHIGLVTGFVYALMSFCWRRSAMLCQRVPAQLAASCASLVTAWIYSALSGFALPTQRAALMVTIFLAAIMLRRRLIAWHAWSLALLIVLLLDPLAVLSESFWLSFGTIALLIFGMQGRLQSNTGWRHWVMPQWVIGIGLIPFSLLFFQEASLISFLANCIAIPWLGFLILPFCLLTLVSVNFSATFAAVTLWVADKSLALLWVLLSSLANMNVAVFHQALLSPITFITTTMACLLLLLPRGAPERWLSCFWILPLFLQSPTMPAAQEFWLTVLDVGQGLSVVVQTNQHVLVYDAGPNYGDKFNMGEAVVLPFLYSQGIHHVDSMVISHGDNDHIGGAKAIMRNVPVTSVLTSAMDKLAGNRVHPCRAGMQWQWDGVTFTMLYPDAASLTLGNDSSCVLMIDNGRHRALLTGDIEKFAERQLLRMSTSLAADLLIAPHHGSKTSSQSEFIAAVAPLYVVYATGYRNRYHFPHEIVTERYRTAGVLALNTVTTGAIQFTFTQQPLWRPRLYV